MTFCGGIGRFDYGEWIQHPAQKHDFFVYAFNKIPDPDRSAWISWNWAGVNVGAATPEQWQALAVQHPDAFKNSPDSGVVPFVTASSDLNIFKAEAAVLQNNPGPSAAVINSMALATPDDMWPAVKHLMEETWYFPTQSWDLLNNPMWPDFANIPRDAAHKLPAGYYENLFLRFGVEYTAGTPLAIFRPDVAGNYILTAWRWNAPVEGGDTSKFVARMRSLDWVPYTAEQRTAVFGPAYAEFKQWAEQVRQANAGFQKNVQDLTKSLTDTKAARRGERRSAQDDNKAALAAATKAQADATKAQRRRRGCARRGGAGGQGRGENGGGDGADAGRGQGGRGRGGEGAAVDPGGGAARAAGPAAGRPDRGLHQEARRRRHAATNLE